MSHELYIREGSEFDFRKKFAGANKKNTLRFIGVEKTITFFCSERYVLKIWEGKKWRYICVSSA